MQTLRYAPPPLGTHPLAIGRASALQTPPGAPVAPMPMHCGQGVRMPNPESEHDTAASRSLPSAYIKLSHGTTVVARPPLPLHPSSHRSPAPGIRGFPSLLYFRNGKYQKHKGPRTLDGLKEFVFNKGGSDIEWNEVPGEPGMYWQLRHYFGPLPTVFSAVYPIIASGVLLLSARAYGALIGACYSISCPNSRAPSGSRRASSHLRSSSQGTRSVPTR